MQRVDGIAAGVEGFEDVTDAQGNGDRGAPIEAAERVKVAVEGQTGDDAEGEGVAERRAVAVKIGEDVQSLCQSQTLALAQFHDAMSNSVVHFRCRLATRAMPADDVIKQGTSGGLPTFVEPDAGKHGTEIGPPDTCGRPVFGGQRHDAT
jgi:hypothetical protein